MRIPQPGQTCGQRVCMASKRAMNKRVYNGNDAPMEVRANLIRLTSADGVALRAAGLEEGSTLGRVTYTRQSSSTAFSG